jgi:hypothetical protein
MGLICSPPDAVAAAPGFVFFWVISRSLTVGGAPALAAHGPSVQVSLSVPNRSAVGEELRSSTLAPELFEVPFGKFQQMCGFACRQVVHDNSLPCRTMRQAGECERRVE